MVRATVEELKAAIEVLLKECTLEVGAISTQVQEVLDNPRPLQVWHIREPGQTPRPDALLSDGLVDVSMSEPKHDTGRLAQLFKQDAFVSELLEFLRNLRNHLELYTANAESHGPQDRYAQFYLEGYKLAFRGEDTTKRQLD